MRGEFGLEPTPSYGPYVANDLESTLDRYFRRMRVDKFAGKDVRHYERTLPSEMSRVRDILEGDRDYQRYRAQLEAEGEDMGYMPETRRDYEYELQNEFDMETSVEDMERLYRRYPRDADELLKKAKGDARDAERLGEELDAKRKQEDKERTMRGAIADLSNIYEFTNTTPETKGLPKKGEALFTGLGVHKINRALRAFSDEEAQAIRKQYWMGTDNKGRTTKRGENASPDTITSIAKKYSQLHGHTIRIGIISDIIQRRKYHELPLAEGEPVENLKKLTGREEQTIAQAKKLGVPIIVGKGGKYAMDPEVALQIKKDRAKALADARKAKADADPEAYKAAVAAKAAKALATKAAKAAADPEAAAERKKKQGEKVKAGKAKAKAARGAGQSNAAASSPY